MNYEQFTPNNKNIFLVDMTKEKNKIFSELTLKWIKKYLSLWKKIWIIVNKKWFSTGVICEDCWNVPKCKNCDVSIAYHLNTSWETFWLCHLCKTHYNTFSSCPKCWWYNINQYWFWTQKIKEQINNLTWIKPLIIESKTVNSPNKIQKINNIINNYQIIIWTSLLTTPITQNKFDLVIFLNADIGLNIPDFNANFNNFIFLYEAFEKHSTQNFIVQTFNPQNYSIKDACKMDFEWFREKELKYRKIYKYPPYTEICVIMYKNEIEEKLFNKVNTLYQDLLFLKEKSEFKDIEIFSTPPMVYKMFGKYRYNIIIKSKDLRQFMDFAFVKLRIFEKWFKIDREPNNLV